MLIELPQLEYSMDDCQDLFISKMDEDYDDIDIDRYPPSNSKNDDRLTVPHDRGVRGHLSDAEPFYTSSSESDADGCFSDIEPLRRGMPSSENIHSAMPLSERKTAQKDLALHSPGQLLGTPRDPSRRYEYPFPAHLQAGQSGSDFSDDGSSSSTASTPGLTPGEGSSLGLVALAATLTADLNTVSRYTSLWMDLPGSIPAPTPIPVPAPVPSPIAVPNTNSTHIVTKGSHVSALSQVPFVPGPSSASALGINWNSNTSTSMNSSTSSLIAAHPKLSRFKPANMPVPPGLRGRTRTRKSASVSSVPVPILPQQGMVASVSIPISVSSVAAVSAAQAVAVSSVVEPTTTVESR
ncbi:hypothetical protein ACEPAH_5463 [Sanghuangporus vaninii]